MAMPTGIHLGHGEPAAGGRFNYTGTHRYFVKLPVHGQRPVFISAEPAVVVLQALREACWHHHFDTYAYCFLPDCVLLIVRGKSETSNLKEFLREFRITSQRYLGPVLRRTVWSTKYLERVLRKTELSPDAARRIFALPVQRGLATSPLGYPLQGSFVEKMTAFYRLPPGERKVGRSFKSRKARR
jgi:REP element-mobilizing transposase RayT